MAGGEKRGRKSRMGWSGIVVTGNNQRADNGAISAMC